MLWRTGVCSWAFSWRGNRFGVKRFERTDLVRGAVYEDPPLFVHQRWEGSQFRISFTATLQVLDTKPDFDTVFAHVKKANPEYDYAVLKTALKS